MFVGMIIFEAFVVIYTNRQLYDETDQITLGTSTMTLVMVVLIGINSLQPGFNLYWYEKLCKHFHRCCLVCIKCCIYRKKHA